MTTADDIREAMIDVNRRTYLFYENYINEKKKEISDKIIEVKTVDDAKNILKTIENLIVDMKTMSQLDMEYNSLTEGKNYV